VVKNKTYTLEYQELENFIIYRLNQIEHGKLKGFCEKNGLSPQEVSRFRNRNLPNTRPFFLQNILKALGYGDIVITTKIFYQFKG